MLICIGGAGHTHTPAETDIASVGLTKDREMRGSRGAQHLAHTWEVEVGPHGRGRLAAGPGRGPGALCVSLPLEQREAPMTQFCPRRGKSRPDL